MEKGIFQADEYQQSAKSCHSWLNLNTIQFLCSIQILWVIQLSGRSSVFLYHPPPKVGSRTGARISQYPCISNRCNSHANRQLIFAIYEMGVPPLGRGSWSQPMGCFLHKKEQMLGEITLLVSVLGWRGFCRVSPGSLESSPGLPVFDLGRRRCGQVFPGSQESSPDWKELFSG